jgi:hypothetical protein
MKANAVVTRAMKDAVNNIRFEEMLALMGPPADLQWSALDDSTLAIPDSGAAT